LEISVRAENLTKRFDKFTAVDDISFAVEKGEVYGFLGANGAGKTTTIRMLCGLLEPTSGDAMVAGVSIKDQPEEVKKRLGYMSQKFSLYPVLTVAENISFYAGIYGMDEACIKNRIPGLCAEVLLVGMEDRKIGDMPGGLKQRVALACAIAHKPQVVFLDEPTAGVDPILRRRFWDIIRMQAESGTTVFVTTHYMDEVEHCNRIAMMHAGKIIKEGTIQEIKKSVIPGPIIEIETESPVETYRVLMEKKERLGDISIHGALIHIIPKPKVFDVKQQISEVLKQASITFTAPEEVEPTMDDVFVNLVKRYEKNAAG
jgi:ABC-2 type transport system ATP-binding protein